jgi:TonB family protein
LAQALAMAGKELNTIDEMRQDFNTEYRSRSQLNIVNKQLHYEKEKSNALFKEHYQESESERQKYNALIDQYNRQLGSRLRQDAGVNSNLDACAAEKALRARNTLDNGSTRSNITPPVAVFTPEPDFTLEARAAHFQGEVELSTLIMPSGRLCDVTVIKPLGMGLDEKAIQAVYGWKFRPATRNGVPAVFPMKITVSFNLY